MGGFATFGAWVRKKKNEISKQLFDFKTNAAPGHAGKVCAVKGKNPFLSQLTNFAASNATNNASTLRLFSRIIEAHVPFPRSAKP